MDKPDESYILMMLKAVEAVFGRCPMSPADFDLLSAQISRGNRHDSVASSTLKRLWGYVKNSHRPTFTTLSVLARYAGYRDWNHFMSIKTREESESGFSTREILVTAEIPLGTTLRIDWGSDKSCTVTKIGSPSQFLVITSENIKLRKGDTIIIDTLAVGQRLVARDCVRSGLAMGAYIGARDNGIARIESIE